MPQSLAEMVRDKIDAGALPLDRPAKLWAGQGSGGSCAACDQPTLSSQVEFERSMRGAPPSGSTSGATACGRRSGTAAATSLMTRMGSSWPGPEELPRNPVSRARVIRERARAIRA